jgi:hypothetical protein
MNLDLGDTRFILQECKKHKLTRQQVAYILATAYWETNRIIKPIKEAYWLSEDWRRRNLRYYPYYGRGYVQLTWKENYEKAGKELGQDFVKSPGLLEQPEFAAPILVKGMMDGWFTGKKLDDYINEHLIDYYNARRIVNGLDKAQTIAGIAKDYEKVLEESDYREDKSFDLIRFIIGLLTR